MEDQVSSHLLTKVPTARLTESVGDVRKRLFSRRKNWECVSYVYVLDANDKLRGVASLKELLSAPVKKKMSAFKRVQMATVRMHTPVTVAVARSLKHNIRTVP